MLNWIVIRLIISKFSPPPFFLSQNAFAPATINNLTQPGLLVSWPLTFYLRVLVISCGLVLTSSLESVRNHFYIVN